MEYELKQVTYQGDGRFVRELGEQSKEVWVQSAQGTGLGYTHDPFMPTTNCFIIIHEQSGFPMLSWTWGMSTKEQAEAYIEKIKDYLDWNLSIQELFKIKPAGQVRAFLIQTYLELGGSEDWDDPEEKKEDKNTFYTVNFTIRGHITIRGDISPYAAYNCARAQLESLTLEDELGEVLEFEPAYVDLHEISDADGDDVGPDEEWEKDIILPGQEGKLSVSKVKRPKYLENESR